MKKDKALAEYYMARAVRLAEKARGDTYPNPIVGAVIVKNSEIIGEGYHQQAGLPHAEVIALKKAGAKAVGADLYVTLEPCSHYGRTPPCTEAIIKAGVKRVFIGIQDPNPKVNGNGLKLLQAKGIEVYVGILTSQIKQQLAGYLKRVETGLPFIHLKAALSLDGKVAAKLNTRTRLTSQKALNYVQLLRRQADAILTGVNTVIVDDPLLTYRLKRSKKAPLFRVVVDAKARTPLTSNLLKTVSPTMPVIVATTKQASLKRLQTLEAAGAQTIICRQEEGKVDLVDLMQNLAQKEIANVLVEAGPNLTASLLRHNLVDKVTLFLAPTWLGAGGVSWLNKPYSFTFTELKQFGPDIMLTGVVADSANRHCER